MATTTTKPTALEPELFEYDELEVEDRAVIEDDESDGGLRFSITSYGADYPVDALVKRLNSGAIEIPTFQRGFVWTLPQSSRFIESLLLGLPVPAVFLSKHPATQRLLTSAMIEVACRHYVGRYVEKRAAPVVQSYVARQLYFFQNPKTEYVEELLRGFAPSLAERFLESMLFFAVRATV